MIMRGISDKKGTPLWSPGPLFPFPAMFQNPRRAKMLNRETIARHPPPRMGNPSSRRYLDTRQCRLQCRRACIPAGELGRNMSFYVCAAAQHLPRSCAEGRHPKEPDIHARASCGGLGRSKAAEGVQDGGPADSGREEAS